MNILFESSNFTVISSLQRKNTPRTDGVFFQHIKKAILGEKYNLNIIYIGTKKMCNLNTKYRKKTYATDILSFNLDTQTGEIYICPNKAKSKAKIFNKTYEEYLHFLLIHGMLHLKGFDHETAKDAEKMEKEEQKWLKKFKLL